MTLHRKIIFLAAMVLLLGEAHAATTLRIATVAPEGSGWVTTMRAGAEEIERRTEGRVQVKYYTGGVMGSDSKVLRKMRMGQLDGASLGIGSLEARYPGVYLYGLPLMFRDFAEVDYVRARMDQTLREGLAEAGLVSFGIAGGGFAKLMANFPVHSLADLRGRKIWVPEGDRVSYAAMEALGLAPVVLPLTDVLTGLQTRLIEAVAVPPIGALALQWHTRIKYVVDLPVAYSAATLVIEDKSLGKVSPEDRAVLTEVMERIYREFDQANRPDNEAALQAMLANGVELIEPAQGDVPQWRKAVYASNRAQADKGTFDAALLSTLEAHLAEHRSNAGGTSMARDTDTN